MGLLKYLLVPLLKLFVYEAKGFERIPKQGPAILVANHASYIDGFLVVLFTDWCRNREARGIQSSEWLGKGWVRRFIFITLLNQIPTDGSVEKALDALRNGELLMLFPEGTRTYDGKLQKTKHTGLGVLASLSGAPVIPIGIEGSYDWWSRHRALPTFRPRCIAMRAGKPLRFTGKANKQGFLAFQRKAMNAIAKLARTTYPY
jgi:1-acyl-sn-glycerol-3-phosphate acyltransferase